MSSSSLPSPDDIEVALRSEFVRNLFWVHQEFPQMLLSSDNIFGLLDYDFRELYANPRGLFLSNYLAHKDATVQLTKYNELYFLQNQGRILDALNLNTARQFFVENLVLLGILRERFFVPIDMHDPNSDWIVCDIQPPVAPETRFSVWYNEDFDNPRQKITFMLLSTKHVLFKGVKGLGASLNFRVQYRHILSLSLRPCLFRDLDYDETNVPMLRDDAHARLCEPSAPRQLNAMYYPTLFRLYNNRPNQLLLKRYHYMSPLFLHACILSARNFSIENVEMRDFLKYFQSVHRYVKSEYEQLLEENACDAEVFLRIYIQFIIHKKS